MSDTLTPAMPVEVSEFYHHVEEPRPNLELPDLGGSRGALLADVGESSAVTKMRRTKRWRKFTRKAMYESRRFAGLSTLSVSMSTRFSWNAQVALTGAAYTASINQSAIQKSLNMGTAAANAAVGGSDEVFSFQQGCVAGGSAVINLNAMTDLLQRVVTPLVRAKGYQTRLLSAADDSTITPAPNNTSTGVVTNLGPANPSQLDYSAGGSGLTLNLTVSGGAVNAVAIGAAGSGYIPSSTFTVLPVQNGGSGAVIWATTNSGGVPTTVGIAAGGANYTNATVPSVCAGQYKVYTGGYHMYADPSAAGFCSISTSAFNVKLFNLDGTNAITWEFDLVGGTT